MTITSHMHTHGKNKKYTILLFHITFSFSFNHLCLPNYDTFELFKRALVTAINEGFEGVLLE